MRLFISYSRLNGEFAYKLSDGLQARGYHIWIDKREIDPGQDFSADIETAIEAADVVLALISRDTKRYDSFVRREIQYAVLLNKRIVPVIIEPHASPPLSIITHSGVDISRLPLEAAINVVVQELGNLETIPLEVPVQAKMQETAKQVLRDDKPIARIFIAYSRSQRHIARGLSELLKGMVKRFSMMRR